MKMLWQLKFKAMDTNGGNMLFIGNKQIHLACSHFQQSISPMRYTYDFVWINFIFFFFCSFLSATFFYSIPFYLPVYAALFSSRKLADREFLSSTETKLEFVTRDRFFFVPFFRWFYHFISPKIHHGNLRASKKNTPSIFVVCVVFFKKNSLSGLTSAQIAAVEQKFFLQKRNRRNIVCIVNMVGSNAGFLTTWSFLNLNSTSNIKHKNEQQRQTPKQRMVRFCGELCKFQPFLRPGHLPVH